MRYLRLLVVWLVLSVGAVGQLVLPSAIAYESPSGLIVTARMAYYSPPFDNIVGEWYAFLCPDLSRYGPTTEPPIQPWHGADPPAGLGLQWLGTPLSPPLGPVFSYLTQAQTGEAVLNPSVYGGCSWGYSAMGFSMSGAMDMAVWAIPSSVEVSGWWVYYVGTTVSSAFGGPKFWGAWAQVR